MTINLSYQYREILDVCIAVLLSGFVLRYTKQLTGWLACVLFPPPWCLQAPVPPQRLSR